MRAKKAKKSINYSNVLNKLGLKGFVVVYSDAQTEDRADLSGCIFKKP